MSISVLNFERVALVVLPCSKKTAAADLITLQLEEMREVRDLKLGLSNNSTRVSYLSAAAES